MGNEFADNNNMDHFDENETPDEPLDENMEVDPMYADYRKNGKKRKDSEISNENCMDTTKYRKTYSNNKKKQTQKRLIVDLMIVTKNSQFWEILSKNCSFFMHYITFRRIIMKIKASAGQR